MKVKFVNVKNNIFIYKMAKDEPSWLKEAGEKIGYKPKRGRPPSKEYKKDTEPKWLKEAGEPLEAMTVKQLKALAKKHKISGFSKLNKTSLIKLIKRELK